MSDARETHGSYFGPAWEGHQDEVRGLARLAATRALRKLVESDSAFSDERRAVDTEALRVATDTLTRAARI